MTFDVKSFFRLNRNNEIYILGKFNIEVYLNNLWIFEKKITSLNYFKKNCLNRPFMTSKNTMNSVQYLVLNN